MNERRDDTTKSREESRDKSGRAPGGYYYDDATGYEIYEPAELDERDEEEESGGRGREAGAARSGRGGFGQPFSVSFS